MILLWRGEKTNEVLMEREDDGCGDIGIVIESVLLWLLLGSVLLVVVVVVVVVG